MHLVWFDILFLICFNTIKIHGEFLCMYVILTILWVLYNIMVYCNPSCPCRLLEGVSSGLDWVSISLWLYVHGTLFIVLCIHWTDWGLLCTPAGRFKSLMSQSVANGCVFAIQLMMRTVGNIMFWNFRILVKQLLVHVRCKCFNLYN